MDGLGNILKTIKGPGTNHWSIGLPETAARINAMIERGKEQLRIPQQVRLDYVGLLLSGCEEEKTNQELSDILMREYPYASKGYFVDSDILGSIRTALVAGGISLIAGTGSNSVLINPDGSKHTCGGWGYMMGDEGGGWWIARLAIKTVFDDIDGLVRAPYPVTYVWPAMRSYFGVQDLRGMLPYLYTNFDKSHVAAFTKEIVAGCEKRDPLCLHIFGEAGKTLAKHVLALSKKADSELREQSGGLRVICVGSIFQSWTFLKKGFTEEIHKNGFLAYLTLMKLSKPAAVGGCYIAAEKSDISFVKPYKDNAETFYQYNKYTYNDSEETLNMIPCKGKCRTRALGPCEKIIFYALVV
ncbi:N-acetyl-D-glucosamine kinase isoform X2 [Prorops nasuta]